MAEEINYGRANTASIIQQMKQYSMPLNHARFLSSYMVRKTKLLITKGQYDMTHSLKVIRFVEMAAKRIRCLPHP